MNNQAEVTNEFEAQFYGFSPLGFSDSIYNIVIDTWETVLKKCVMQRPEVTALEQPKRKALMTSLLGLLTTNNLLEKIIRQLEEYTLKYVFRIPNCVTLPEHECNLRLPIDYDVKTAKKNVKRLEEKIVRQRAELQDIDAQIAETREALTLMRGLNNIIIN